MKILRARVTTKGQVTLPKGLRDSLGLHKGDHVEFSVEAPNNASIRKLGVPGNSAGALKHLAKSEPSSVEEMDAAIRQNIQKKYGSLRIKK